MRGKSRHNVIWRMSSVLINLSLRLRSVSVDLPLAEVLQLLTKHRLHRLYVVDADLKPIGLVTLTVGAGIA